jgi:mono/diheme cytochrome c family protein
MLVAGVLAVAGTGEREPSAATSPQSPAPDSRLVGNGVAGKEIFTQYCSICHGVVAKGFIGPHIAGIDWTAPGLIAIVRGGVGGYGGMPAFNAEVVTDQNVADVAAYLVSLAPASLPKAATTPAATAPAVIAPASAAPTATSAPPPTVPAAGDPVHGRQVYAANCSACHGANAQGGVGPGLHGEKNRKDLAAAIAWIENPKLPMPKLYPSVISRKDVEDVAAYVESL